MYFIYFFAYYLFKCYKRGKIAKNDSVRMLSVLFKKTAMTDKVYCLCHVSVFHLHGKIITTKSVTLHQYDRSIK